jgi:hypothetical protein
MAQIKQPVSVTNGSQTVTVTGDFTTRIKQKSIFMVETELVPYTVAADSTYSAATGKTTVTLTGNYVGTTNAAAAGVFAVDFTFPNNIPTIAQGDVGTAAIFTKAMYRVEDMVAELDASLGGSATSGDVAAAAGVSAIGDLIYASATNAVGVIPDVATGNVLLSGGVGAAPSYGKVGLTTHVTGLLPNANGGTGKSTTWTQWGLVYASTTTALANIAAGTAKQVLSSNGSAAPAMVTLDMTYLPGAAFKKSVRMATTANLAGTRSTNVITASAVGIMAAIDGITPVLNDRVLVKNQTNAADNGIYYISNVGTASVAWTLTRVTDADAIDEAANAIVCVDSGTVNGGQVWTASLKSTDTLNTTAMNWFRLHDGMGRNSFQATSARVLAQGSVAPGTVNFSTDLYSEWSLTLSAGAYTFAFLNPPATDQTMSARLRLTNAGLATITWPASTKFPGGALGTLTSAGVDLLEVKWDGLTSTWMVFPIAKDIR